MFTHKGTNFYYNGVNDSILGFYKRGLIEELKAYIEEELKKNDSLLCVKKAITNNNLEELSKLI